MRVDGASTPIETIAQPHVVVEERNLTLETVLVLPEHDDNAVVVDGLELQPDTVPCAACLKRVPLPTRNPRTTP